MVGLVIDSSKYGINNIEEENIININGFNICGKFDGIEKEIEAINTNVGLLDLSYMVNITIKGEQAEEYLQYITTADIKSLRDNEVLYTFICYPNGGIIDDLLVLKVSKNNYMLLLNGINIDNVYKWMQANLYMYNVEISNKKNNMKSLAIEGIKSREFIENIARIIPDDIKNNNFKEIVINEDKYLLIKSSYTGIQGFIISGENDKIVKLYDFIMNNKNDLNITPIGFEAQNIVRFDSGIPVYGVNINEDISPFEVGYDSVVDMTKEDFIGKYAFEREMEDQIGNKIVHFEFQKEEFFEVGAEIVIDDIICGRVISIISSFRLNKNIGIAAIEKKYHGVEGLIVKKGDQYIQGKIMY